MGAALQLHQTDESATSWSSTPLISLVTFASQYTRLEFNLTFLVLFAIDRMNKDQPSPAQHVAPSEFRNGPAPENDTPIPTGDTPATATATAAAPAHADEISRAVENILQSDIGVSVLLNRLKQSIVSTRDFAAFLGKRSALEEVHATGLRKICRTTHEAIRRSDSRQGSYAQQLDEVIRTYDRMVENGLGFSLSLHQMQEDLLELAANMERGRKHWKQTGMSAEKRVQDSEMLMEKAKVKYDSLAEDYDRARAGGGQPTKIFSLKGPRSTAQHEEDLHRKLQNADADYLSKVKSANAQRQELLSSLRPQAMNALRDLIAECDSGLTLQLQKFASFNEKLLLNNGLTISPINPPAGTNPESRSLRDLVYSVDNEKDLKGYLMSFSSKVQPKAAEIKYERHPATPHQQTPPPTHRQSQSSLSQPPPVFPMQASQPQIPPTGPAYTPQTSSALQRPPGGEFGLSGEPMSTPQRQYQLPVNISGPPQLSAPTHFAPISLGQPRVGTPPSANTTVASSFPADLPPPPSLFGVSLQTLFQRDGLAVPMIVYQCIHAIDMYGLEVEGIYRVSGNNSHVQSIKEMFGKGGDSQKKKNSSKVNFRNSEDFYGDVNSVASVLKQFFIDLPDPLLTSRHYDQFIAAAKQEDNTLRRDSLHALINDLPDANYATLRALVLHLDRVQRRSSVNRMDSGNLAICFGPTLMGPGSSNGVADAAYQARVIDTILQNTFQIFDDD
ncbi:MAG: hypothetical protein M1840_004127 [Geoglossum simile]|nr:MAG: hypothetical protein M1840_004127 [Geoglossum simile]